MLKHHCSTLFILPTPKTLQSAISSPSFIDETTPSSYCFAFSFPLLKHHCQQPFIIFPDAETPLFNTFHSSHSQNTTVRHLLTILHRRNNTVQLLFRLFFSIAETPLSATLHHFSPMLKHHCSALFILPTPKTLQSAISSPSFIDETTPSKLFHLFFSVAETPLSATLHHFSPMLKHHCSTLSTFSC
jgi:hypothetical protein